MSTAQAYALPGQISAVSPLTGSALDGAASVKPQRKNRGAMSASVMIPVDKLEHHPDNTRKKYLKIDELAATMDEVGQLQDCVVCPQPAKGGYYWVIVGNRRLLAAELLGWADLRCTVRSTVLGVKATLKAMLIENWEHMDVNPIEKAEALGRLHFEEKMTEQQIADALGKHISTISTHLALLDLSEETRRKVSDKELSVAAATKAVRAARAKQRQKNGHKDQRLTTALSWEPDHFTEYHFLSRRAKFWCDAGEHNNRRRRGGACDRCWERAIRENERKLALAEVADTAAAAITAVQAGQEPENLEALPESLRNAIVMTRGNHLALVHGE